jgi:hydroxymethylbilane synthase
MLHAQASSPAPTVAAALELGSEVARQLEALGAFDIVRSLATAAGAAGAAGANDNPADT